MKIMKFAAAWCAVAFSSFAASAATLPANTMIVVTPVQEVTSKKMKEGDAVAFQVVNDVVENGAVIIPRGTPVKGTVTWRTGKGIGGKSAKFEVTFNSVQLAGRDWGLRGSHRQEGRGNTMAALFGSMLISGRSAVMVPGQLVNAFTSEAIVTQ
ncbi:hypothetical protein LL253_08170 [Sphingobium soli]|jgi:hypothetical protein|uniref:Uncharacterized protein n=1 Tax=Sphingobium soli TaxID=1591116 RepID=A0ABS8H2B1_9SPHN|nr:hypothetical protein [Sphingobium soli]MCC4232665.1 hypothetical protein [Sphingobium soli]